MPQGANEQAAQGGNSQDSPLFRGMGGVVLLRAGQGVVSALLLLVHIHVDDALVSWAFALERIAVALKARVSVEERRDGRLVLG